MGQLVQVFPQTPNSLACFSVNNKNTQRGNVSKKRIRLSPPRQRGFAEGMVRLLRSLGKGSFWLDTPIPGRGLASP